MTESNRDTAVSFSGRIINQFYSYFIGYGWFK